MSSAPVYVTQGDVGLTLSDALLQGDEEILDLSDAASVELLMAPERKLGPPPAATGGGAGVIDSAAGGTVHYVTQVDDFAQPGTYSAEWRVTFNSGEVVHVPSQDFYRIIVRPSLG